MYCPSCGYEIAVELNYCKRCGANLSLPSTNLTVPPPAPVSLTGPSVFLAATIICGLGIIFAGANELIVRGLSPLALTWIVLFSMATLFGCTALFIHFWTKMVSLQRESGVPLQGKRQPAIERPVQQQLPPRFEPVPSVTENTTRTFSPIYREPSK
jgi:hypothetical protein